MSRESASSNPISRGTQRWIHLAFAAVLVVFALENFGAMWVTTATSDETSHLPAGYSYLKTGDYRLNPQHPPLAKILAALPLLALAPSIDTADPGWTSSPPDEWGFGERFLYSHDAGRLLFWGRVPIVLLGLIACGYVRLWARDLYGEAAGLGAAALFALCPTVVGHSHLVTMDVPLTAFSVGALYHLRSWGMGGKVAHLVAAGIATGCALATKFSAVAYLPAFAVLVILVAVKESRAGALRRATGSLVMMLGVAAVVVWMSYGFPFHPGFYLDGLQRINRDHNPTVPDYLLGQFRIGGFWYYFPVAFVLKTPLPILGLIVVGLALAWRRRSPWALDEAFLLLPAAIFLGATMVKAAGIGVRYLIPLYPPLIVSASRVIPPLVRSTVGAITCAALLIWLFLGAAWIHPDYLAYFNEAAGGPSHGPELLDDSNLTWGGGLSRLKTWMDTNHVVSVRLLYPWNGSPDYYGIHYAPVTRQDWLIAPSPGIYAIDTVALVRGRLPAKEEDAHSDWIDRYTPIDSVGYAFRIYAFGDDGRPMEHP